MVLGLVAADPQLGAQHRHPRLEQGVVSGNHRIAGGDPDLVLEPLEAVASRLQDVAAWRHQLEAKRILDRVEEAGIFAGYLEDLCYTPKTLKAIGAVESGAIGDVTWVRSRETHPGPHSAWFWDKDKAGGGAIVDLGCHCIEIIRSFVGKGKMKVVDLSLKGLKIELKKEPELHVSRGSSRTGEGVDSRAP